MSHISLLDLPRELLTLTAVYLPRPDVARFGRSARRLLTLITTDEFKRSYYNFRVPHSYQLEAPPPNHDWIEMVWRLDSVLELIPRLQAAVERWPEVEASNDYAHIQVDYGPNRYVWIAAEGRGVCSLQALRYSNYEHDDVHEGDSRTADVDDLIGVIYGLLLDNGDFLMGDRDDKDYYLYNDDYDNDPPGLGVATDIYVYLL